MELKLSPRALRGAIVAAVAIAVVGALVAVATMDRSAASSWTAGHELAAGSDVVVGRVVDLPSQTGDAVSAQVGFTNGTITVTRSASVNVDADHAVLDLGVEAIGATVSDARRDAALALTDILEALEAAGIAADDIATSRFEIAPETQWVESRVPLQGGTSVTRGTRELIGYTVRNQVSAVVRDLDTVGDVIDAAAEAGGDSFRVPGIRFEASDNEVAADQARVLAAADARRVAELYANSLGFALGPVVSMTEYQIAPFAQPQFRLEATATADAATPIVPGDIAVSATVEVQFAILGASVATGG